MNVPRLRFPGFSSPWETRDLHEFIVDMVGGAPLVPEEILDHGDYKIIPKKAIQAGGKIRIGDDCNYVTSDVFEKYSANCVDKTYIIVVLRDLVPSGPNIGYAVENDKVNEGVLAQGVYGIHLNDMIDKKYYIQFTNTPKYRDLMHKIMVGSTQVHIRNSAYINISVPYPSLDEQQKIAEFLSSVDDIISTSEQEVANLETQKKAVMKKVFSQEVRFKRADGTDFPEWETRKMSDGFYIKSRVGWQALSREEYLSSGDYYLVTGTDITNNNVDYKRCWYVSKERYDMDTNIQIRNGDIIITKDGTIGKVAQINGLDKPATLNSHLFLVRDESNETLNTYLLYVFLSPVFTDFVNATKTGSTLTGLPLKTFIEFNFPVPCLEEQRLIADFLSDFDEAIAAAKKELELWKELKRGLLQQMFV